MAKLFVVLYTSFVVWCYVCNIPATCMVNETDRLALVAFKAAIYQDPFGALTSWNDSIHYCDWNGIECGRRHRDRVVELNLISQGLVGELSPHIGNLSFLRRIILQNNSFHGPIPQEIGRLFRLQKIELSNNTFGSDIPSNLSRLSNLEYLNLIDNNLIGNIPNEIGSLSNLAALGLEKNKLTGIIPSSIGNLSSLFEFSLIYCNLQGEIPKEITRLRRLKFVQFSANNLRGKVPLGLYNISTIAFMSIGGNKLDGRIPPDIGSMLPNLEFLGVAENNFTGMIPNSLTNASKLETISIGDNDFTGPMPKDLGKLFRLRGLGFSDNYLQDDLTFMSSLSNCTKLQGLDVYGNLLRGSLPDSIANLSTHVSIIAMGENQLYGRIPSGIENLVSLTVFILPITNLTGPIPMAIGKLSKLQELDLSMNKITKIPSSLGNLTSLNLLQLQYNNIFGKLPQSLGNCSKLSELDLSHNDLFGPIPPEIMSLSSVSISFNLASNSLTGALPSEVKSFQNLAYLDVSNNRLTGNIPNSLSNCLSLEWLHLEGNSFEGEIPRSLKNLMGLRELDLSHNNLSGLIPSFLGELRLEKLNLSFNVLHGEVPTEGVFQNGSAISVIGNNDLCGGIAALSLPPCSSSKSNQNKLSQKVKVVLYAVVPLMICLALGGGFLTFLRRRNVSKKKSTSLPSFKHQLLRVSYAELLAATNGFSEANLIGVGSYASLYRGILDQDQIPVAVKVLNLQLRGALTSFMSECRALQTIRHRNLLKVVSACSSIDFHGNEFKAIVYELMTNGNLHNWLHQDGVVDHIGEHQKLKFIQRLDISIDIASAIEYLHCGCESTIIHGDLKPSNVLLDDEMTAHVGDFGLAKIISTTSSEIAQGQSNSGGIRGTIGYVAPEYGLGDIASTPGDVYSFGVLLLEMFTGKRPTNGMFEDHLNIHNFVNNALPDRVMEIVDPYILLEHDTQSWMKDCMVSVMRIGVACSMQSPRDRMEMGSVVSELRKIKNTCVNEHMVGLRLGR